MNKSRWLCHRYFKLRFDELTPPQFPHQAIYWEGKVQEENVACNRVHALKKCEGDWRRYRDDADAAASMRGDAHQYYGRQLEVLDADTISSSPTFGPSTILGHNPGSPRWPPSSPPAHGHPGW